MDSEIFLHPFTSPGGRKVILNSLTLEICPVPGKPSPFDPDRLLQKYRSFSLSPGVTMATFFVTGACPRKCGYCFVPATLGTMTGAEVRNGMELFRKMAADKADILIYGGEPLLEPELVMGIIKNAQPGHNLCLATGGLEFPERIAESMAERDGFVIVSMDGREDIHNALRPLPGRNSHSMALKTFSAFRSAGCRVGISMTVTRGNATRVRDDFLHLMDTLKPDDMGLNIWMHPGPGTPVNSFEARWQDVFEAITGCLRHALAEGMYVEQLFRRLRPLVTSTPRLRDCPSRGGRLVFSPGGAVSPCDCMAAAGVYCARSPQEVPSLLDSFARLVPVYRDECLSCPCVALCGGGCLYDAMARTGSLTGVKEERCSFERAFLQWLLGLITDSLPPDRPPGPLSPSELAAFLPPGILDRARMPQPEGMLGGELR